MYIRSTIKYSTALALLLSACNHDESNETAPATNDLQHDEELTCDHECVVVEQGTAYEAGGCKDGQCGPTWHGEGFSPFNPVDPETVPPPLTCDEVCSDQSVSCVAEGCSGKTGFTCRRYFWGGCEDHERLDWVGSCAETVPWPTLETSDAPEIACCCQ